jgi:phosphatidylethanolamine/phosphatidyl-N-methylethanolamine N-methyltransferase
MLRKAQGGSTNRDKNVERLWVMDAEHLKLPDASFDVVVAQYVITTVHKSGDSTIRACPAAWREIVLVWRVGAKQVAALAGAMVRAGLARKLGWRTEFSSSATRASGRAVERHAAGRAARHASRGHFSLIDSPKPARRRLSRANAGAHRPLSIISPARSSFAPRYMTLPFCHTAFIESP